MDIEKEENGLSDIEAAWDTHESEEAVLEEPTESEDITELSMGEEPTEAVEEPTEAPEPTEEAEAPAPEEAAAEASEPAPVSWKPAVREQWKNLPEEVRKEIQRREKDFAVGIQRSTEAAQYGARMHRMIEPLRPFFNANGLNDETGLQTVMQTAGMLMGGSPPQKAQAVANMIKDYGIDIEQLDGVLAQTLGGQPAQQQAGPDPMVQQQIQQALAPYQQFMGQLTQQQQAQQQHRAQEATQTVGQFSQDPKNEFYMDVREDMAMLLDAAASQNKELSLADAYDRACYMNPEIRNILSQRQLADSEQRRQQASVSVSGSPDGVTETQSPANMRDAIAMAWENSAR
jgi:hypothetical protein